MRKFHAQLKPYLRTVLTQHRAEKGLTQEQMAEALYMTPRSYGSLERGKAGFSAVTLILFLAQLSDEKILAVIRGFAQKLSEYEEKDSD